jgi:hypothetical protein
VDFATPDPGQSPLDAVHERRALAAASRRDTALHGCVVRWDDTTAKQIAAMADGGAIMAVAVRFGPETQGVALEDLNKQPAAG